MNLAEYEIGIPPHYGCLMLLNEFICCCCKTKAYRDYKKMTEKVQNDLEKSLDLVTHIKRMRMHGIALGILMSKDLKRVSGLYGEKRNVHHMGKIESKPN